MIRADLVIIGAGCAGLALAARLAEAGDAAPRTVLVDQRDTYSNDRTWCFWAPMSSPWARLARAHWPVWRIGCREGSSVSRLLDGYPYHCLAASDYYADRRRRIEAHPAMRLELSTPVETVEVDDFGWRIETPRGTIRAGQVVDTRPDFYATPLLWQQFHGMEVRTSRPCFDPSAVELMTDMDSDDAGFVFTYLLPFAEDHALIEVTRFVPEPLPAQRLESDCRRVLAERTDDSYFRQIRQEQACLPMGSWSAGKPDGSGIVRAGIGGGALRSASGYGFLRIQSWADRCARHFLESGRAISHPPEPAWRRAMDARFLALIRRRPEWGPTLFEAMAQGLSAGDFVRFLSDEGGFKTAAKMVLALPKGPFLHQIFRPGGKSIRENSGSYRRSGHARF
ncbi:MAG: lycopene cyclase family protein [Xanthomonadales bacterium]|nr:lycopene cyclase family protein [Xanthomonadales bacterium]